MSIYLQDIPLPEAWSRFEAALKEHHLWGLLGSEEVPLDETALGRVLVEPVWARLSSPHYHASAMDGFAVRARETDGASPTHPVDLSYPKKAQYVDTGDPLPDWANAVIPIENVEPLPSDAHPAQDFQHSSQGIANARQPAAIRIRSAVTPWSHVRPLGEDIVATQLVLPSGHTLRPVDLGAAAAAGLDHLQVARQPKVAILPTGSELLQVGQITAQRPILAGEIIEYNSIVLAAQVNQWGGQAKRFPIQFDQFDAIRQAVLDAAETHDLILLNAGSSAGSEDYSAPVIESIGQLLVHGVAVRPGHPVILGLVLEPVHGRTVPIIGVPGYPVSAAMTGEIFVEPLLARWLGRPAAQPLVIDATLTRKVTSPAGDDDYLRVAVGKVGERTLATPISRGAGVISSLVRADGIVILPRGNQGLPGGAEVHVRLYRSPLEIEKTIFAIGSHDILLDLMAQHLAAHDRRLASANVGSLGGLIALRRGEAHLAGSHLLDPASGVYNLTYLQQYLAGIPLKLVTLAGRQQGLLVVKGNPKNILGLEDLTRKDLRMINRQRGAGTRVLLDYELERKGIATSTINGYNDEEYTHLAVAAAVASGRADCGLGIAAAAQALDLGFIPLFQERYDLVIPTQHFISPLLVPLLELLHDPEFRQQAAQLPGYEIEPMGQIVAEME